VIDVMPDGIRIENATLLSVIRYVYGVPLRREDLIVGGPDWLSRDRFDIAAKATRTLPKADAMVMTQALLQDRFKLVLGKETRERDVYALSVARTDGRLGSDMRQAAADCTPPTLESLLAARRSGSGPPPNTTQCATIAELIVRLERELQTTVVDRTFLTGRWDYALVYSADIGQPPVPGLPPLPPELRRVPSDAPALLTAIQEQLGLKLERTRYPVEVLAIRSAEPPTEN
jgi:uncharacterized protein (TIGR03435 family)